jgi:hypothetical protein
VARWVVTPKSEGQLFESRLSSMNVERATIKFVGDWLVALAIRSSSRISEEL